MSWKLPEGWLSFFLLVVIITTVAWNMHIADWTEGLTNLYLAGVVSLFVGLLLAKSIFPALIAHCFSLVYGWFTLGIIVGRMVDADSWRERLTTLGERTVTWLTKATSGGTSRDTLMFVLFLAALFWLLGYLAAWYTYRHPRLWRALLPGGLTLLINTYIYNYYTNGPASLTPSVLIFVIASLLYTVRSNIYLRQLEWKSAQVRYDSEISLDFMRAGVILALVATTIAWIAPGARAGVSMTNVLKWTDEPWEEVREWWNRVFSSLDTYNRTVANPFGSRINLGGPLNLGNEILFDVKAPRGRYWRAATYDRYTGEAWLNSDSQTIELGVNEPLPLESSLMRDQITQTITIYWQGLTQIMAAPQLVRVVNLSTHGQAYYDQGEYVSVSTLYSNQTLRAGDAYMVISSVSRADPDTLRRVGNDYPDWVEKRYLQLPNSVTERTRLLAEEITADYDNAFDKAQAIESYLRENLVYDLDVPGSPEDQDFVDFVLFDMKTGYCDYYASSFVVLARSVGVPARLAAGYAQGDWDAEVSAFRVRAHNGHSWPEVYFPQHGWVEFEPTVAIQPIDWPEPPPEPSSNDNSDPTRAEDDLRDDSLDRNNHLPEEDDFAPGNASLTQDQSQKKDAKIWLVLGLGMLIALAAGAGLTYWWAEVRGLGGLNLVERAYAKLWRYAEWLGMRASPDQTPYERAEALAAVVPEGQTAINHITDLYVVRRFGRACNLPEGYETEVQQQWGLLRPTLVRNWLQSKLSRFQQEDKRSRWREISRSG